MRSGDILRSAVLVLMLVLLVLGIHRLFALRFESGDVYPPYSSLRTDPLGSRALYEALELLPGVKVRRHYLDIEDIDAAEGDAVFFLGSTAGQLIYTLKHGGDKFVSMAKNGARIVIALRPDPFSTPREADEKEESRQDDIDEDSGAPPGEDEPGEWEKSLPDETVDNGFDEMWGVEVGFMGGAEGLERSARASLLTKSGDLPESIPVYSGLYFRSDDERWRTVYAVNGKPVILERSFDAGSVVLLSDSYLLSNEALRYEFVPGLVTWLMAGGVSAVFDESHLGVFESPGIMSLLRKYRLAGTMTVLVILVLLSAWKSSVPLVQRSGVPGGADEPMTTEKDQFSGFVNLLRRNIGPGAILQTCLEEWDRSFGKRQAYTGDSVNELKTAINHEIAERGKRENPARVYNRITALLAERKGR